MNKQLAIYLVLFFAIPPIASAQPANNTDGPPDSTNWDYEHGFVRNEELQWYQRENTTCTGGLLVIEAKRTQQPNR